MSRDEAEELADVEKRFSKIGDFMKAFGTERAPAQEEATSSALIEAAAKGETDVMERLCGMGGALDANEGDYDQRTALHLAASNGKLAAVEFLIERMGAFRYVAYIFVRFHLASVRLSSGRRDRAATMMDTASVRRVPVQGAWPSRGWLFQSRSRERRFGEQRRKKARRPALLTSPELSFKDESCGRCRARSDRPVSVNPRAL